MCCLRVYVTQGVHAAGQGSAGLMSTAYGGVSTVQHTGGGNNVCDHSIKVESAMLEKLMFHRESAHKTSAPIVLEPHRNRAPQNSPHKTGAPSTGPVCRHSADGVGGQGFTPLGSSGISNNAQEQGFFLQRVMADTPPPVAMWHHGSADPSPQPRGVDPRHNTINKRLLKGRGAQYSPETGKWLDQA